LGNADNKRGGVDMNNHLDIQKNSEKKGFSGKQVFAIVAVSMLIAVVATVLVVKYYFFPSAFKPVVLSGKEEQRLEQKLDRFAGFGTTKKQSGNSQPAALGFDRGKSTGKDELGGDGKLKPVPYSEKGASRDIEFTEREVNALLAKNTDMADKLAIDLAKDLVSFKLLVPVDPDFPILGGKILRVRGGAELAFRQGRPVVKLKGISLMGVPMPNSWLGGIKNIDLVQEYGADDGFWKSFSTGVESISVEDGALKIVLKE